MEKLKLYVVTKSSTDGSFEVGDMVWLSENGDLNSVRGQGWISKDEWDVPGINDFGVEECNTHYLDVTRRSECVRKYT
ncbi:MAG: hypothetical protein NC489_36730 [Ruminococcus flavefaciens]|nr:hypothetical protein [Ruminococcus flavefaciens]